MSYRVFPASSFQLDADEAHIESVSTKYQNFAKSAGEVLTTVQGSGTDSWEGSEGEQHRQNLKDLSVPLSGAKDALGAVGSALKTYADDISTARTQLNSLRVSAEASHVLYVAALARQESVPSSAPDGVVASTVGLDEAGVKSAQAAADKSAMEVWSKDKAAADSRVASLESEIGGWISKAGEVRARLQGQAKTAANAIRAAAEASPTADQNWFEKHWNRAGAWVDQNAQGLRDWFKNNAGWLGVVATGLRVVGGILMVVGAVTAVLGVGVGVLALGSALYGAGDAIDTMTAWGKGEINGTDMLTGVAISAATSMAGGGVAKLAVKGVPVVVAAATKGLPRVAKAATSAAKATVKGVKATQAKAPVLLKAGLQRMESLVQKFPTDMRGVRFALAGGTHFPGNRAVKYVHARDDVDAGASGLAAGGTGHAASGAQKPNPYAGKYGQPESSGAAPLTVDGRSKVKRFTQQVLLQSKQVHNGMVTRPIELVFYRNKKHHDWDAMNAELQHQIDHMANVPIETLVQRRVQYLEDRAKHGSNRRSATGANAAATQYRSFAEEDFILAKVDELRKKDINLSLEDAEAKAKAIFGKSEAAHAADAAFGQDPKLVDHMADKYANASVGGQSPTVAMELYGPGTSRDEIMLYLKNKLQLDDDFDPKSTYFNLRVDLRDAVRTGKR